MQGQPQPVVLDPRAVWEVSRESKVIRLARDERGRGPLVLVGRESDPEKVKVLKEVGGKVVVLPTREDGRFDWEDVLAFLEKEGLQSVMVEGGGTVINELLSPRHIGFVDTVIVTIAPVWLGKEGVQVCPEERRDQGGNKMAVGRLNDVNWVPLGGDVVLCGRPQRE
jgi:2,5-diamino-6-(ribosylamino)-4(3H)-pyrimidinone 5'-phosphate reductase